MLLPYVPGKTRKESRCLSPTLRFAMCDRRRRHCGDCGHRKADQPRCKPIGCRLSGNQNDYAQSWASKSIESHLSMPLIIQSENGQRCLRLSFIEIEPGKTVDKILNIQDLMHHVRRFVHIQDLMCVGVCIHKTLSAYVCIYTRQDLELLYKHRSLWGSVASNDNHLSTMICTHRPIIQP